MRSIATQVEAKKVSDKNHKVCHRFNNGRRDSESDLSPSKSRNMV